MAQRENDVKTQGEDGHVAGAEEHQGCDRNQELWGGRQHSLLEPRKGAAPAQHLDFRLPAPEP